MPDFQITELPASAVATLESLINEWIGHARWFTKQCANPQAQILHGYTLAADQNSSTTLLIVRAGGADYFLPITLCITDPTLINALSANSNAIVGYLELAGQNLAVVDATEHPHGQLALLKASLGETNTPQLHGAALRGQLADLPQINQIWKLRSEQSNTSIVYEFAHPDEFGSAGIILKLFRTALRGTNPAVELQIALDQAGATAVPQQYGSAKVLFGTATDSPTAHVLIAQEFFANAKDAWQIFQSELAQGQKTPENPEMIFKLGQVTADVHQILAEIFPTLPLSLRKKSTIHQQWEAQAAQAFTAAPTLEKYQSQISEIFATATALTWPDAQRIHGDYHLAQVLATAERGWITIDFEGEPLKPLSQRNLPGLALRDVAGMLRSFSYAAGTAALNGKPLESAQAWAKSANELFLAGYGAISEAESLLCRALELDKALYEVVYEATYRPRWLEIPLQAVAEIVERN